MGFTLYCPQYEKNGYCYGVVHVTLFYFLDIPRRKSKGAVNEN